MAVSRDESVECWADPAYGRQRAQPRQPAPAGELGHDPLPGGEAGKQKTVRVPHPHGFVEVPARNRKVGIVNRSKITKLHAFVRVASLAPPLRELTHSALAVNPDIEGPPFISQSNYAASTC